MSRMPVRLPDYISGFRSRVVNGILDYLRAVEPMDSATIKWERTPYGSAAHYRGTDESQTDLRQWRWARIGGADVKLYGGEIQIGEQAAVACADATVTISVNPSYVGWRYTKSSKTLAIVNFGSSMPATAGTIEKWLYLFSVSGSMVALVADGTLNPVFPANFGDT